MKQNQIEMYNKYLVYAQLYHTNFIQIGLVDLVLLLGDALMYTTKPIDCLTCYEKSPSEHSILLFSLVTTNVMVNLALFLFTSTTEWRKK
jgi:hypothetical protein